MRCPICDGTQPAYLFVIRGLPVVRCRGCGLISLGTVPNSADFSDFYRWRAGDERISTGSSDSTTERDAAERYLQALLLRKPGQGRILVVYGGKSPGAGGFLAAAAKAQGIETELVAAGETPAGSRYAAAVLLHQVQTQEAPGVLLQQVHSVLAPDAPLLVTVPCVESWPAKFFGGQWIEWKPENRYYFDRSTIQLLLLRHGFRNNLVWPDRRMYTLEHVNQRASAGPRTLLTRAITAAHRVIPPMLRQARIRLATSGIVVTAVRAEARERPKCSIVVPAYNESTWFPMLMDALIEKRLPGVDREILIVESNSTDGTREIAKKYAGHPEVKLLLEDRPRGKGHAVRTTLAKASGDIILIQDADLEYDLNDYDALIGPILARRALFVLGSRHAGNWKMRQFSEQEGLATALNLGHVFFTTVLNVLYRQKMTDPFTMFKVFHRDCLYGLEFECNRFDFDHELVIKFLRKGYVPTEIPVNYCSRSFREGKKVRIFRDPLGWLWVDIKLRFTRVLKEAPE
jgi:hypothetical protein